MPINVSEAIDFDTAERISVFRYTGGGLDDDGIWQKGVATEIKTIASVQQPSGKDLQRLPQGQRARNIKKFICKTRLLTVDDIDQIQADEIVYVGKRYEVIYAENWNAYGHTTALAARVKT